MVSLEPARDRNGSFVAARRKQTIDRGTEKRFDANVVPAAAAAAAASPHTVQSSEGSPLRPVPDK